MRLNQGSEKYFNRGENRTHDLDVAVNYDLSAECRKHNSFICY